jgi:hypothetical protein
MRAHCSHVPGDRHREKEGRRHNPLRQRRRFFVFIQRKASLARFHRRPAGFGFAHGSGYEVAEGAQGVTRLI